MTGIIAKTHQRPRASNNLAGQLMQSQFYRFVMLSYRHSFHAGNFADVLKHTVQALIIESLKQKPKPFVYHDTHSAAGRYDLRDAKSEKTGEDGIGQIPVMLIISIIINQL